MPGRLPLMQVAVPFFSRPSRARRAAAVLMPACPAMTATVAPAGSADRAAKTATAGLSPAAEERRGGRVRRAVGGAKRPAGNDELLADAHIDVILIDSDNVVDYHDSDIRVGGMMEYSGKVTSAESLGGILQQARMVAGLSQRELARRLGTTQRYIWELESGKPSILMDRLFAAMRETGMQLTATITVPEDKRG